MGSDAPSFGEIIAVIDEYESDGTAVFQGTYDGLILGPPNSSYEGETIRFFWIEGTQRVPSAQSEIFHASGVPQLKTFNLSFPRSPRSPVNVNRVDRWMLGKVVIGVIAVTIVVRGAMWAIRKERPLEW